MRICDDSGDRVPLHNYVVRKHREFMNGAPAARVHLPDPSADVTDDIFIVDELAALSHMLFWVSCIAFASGQIKPVVV